VNGGDENILLELQKYTEGNDLIKEKCTSDEWCNAYIHLLLKYYKPKKLIPSVVMENEGEMGLTAKILSHFKITKNYNDNGHRITNRNLVAYHSNLGFTDSYEKFRTELIGLGCQEFKIKNDRGLRGLQYIPSEPAPENEVEIPTI
jgi:hypothetical protein